MSLSSSTTALSSSSPCWLLDANGTTSSSCGASGASGVNTTGGFGLSSSALVAPPTPTPTNDIVIFSVDAVFISSLTAMWTVMIVWTVIGVACVFLGAGIHAVRVNTDRQSPRLAYLIFPLLSMIFGGFVGFLQGAISAALIAAAATSLNRSVGVDILTGLGLSQAIVIVYFHLGRADFIHR